MKVGKYKRTKEIRQKMSKARMGKYKGEKNHAWKGENVGYIGLHLWVRKNKPKSMFCEKCGKITDKLEISNISGEYKRDIADYRWLCIKCHRNSDFPDGKIGKNLHKSNVKSKMYKKFSKGNLHKKNG